MAMPKFERDRIQSDGIFARGNPWRSDLPPGRPVFERSLSDPGDGSRRKLSIDLGSFRSRIASMSQTVNQAAKALFRGSDANEFWISYLRSVELVLDLPLDKGNRDNATATREGPIQFLQWTLPIPAEIHEDLSELLNDQTETSIVMVYVTWLCLLGRMARASEFVNGFGVDCASTSSSFPTSLVPIIVPLEADDGTSFSASQVFKSTVKELKGMRQKLDSDGSVNLESIVRALGLSTSDETTHPLFQTAFVVGQPVSGENAIWNATHGISSESAPQVLQLRVRPPDASAVPARVLTLQLLFWEDVFSVESAANLQKQINGLFGVLTGVHGKFGDGLKVSLSELPSIGKAQENELKEWSDTTNYNVFKPGQMHVKFAHSATRDPGRLALIDSKEGGSEDAYTYGELHSLCLMLAKRLQEEFSVTLDTLVPLLFERGVRMVVAIYGTLMAGGAYVPLEPHYPGARILGIVQQVEPVVTLTVPALGEMLNPEKLGAPAGAWPVLGLGDIQRSVVAGAKSASIELQLLGAGASARRAPKTLSQLEHEKQQAGGGLVYVFFTSGSTGTPKGVMCEHAGLRHRIEWMDVHYALQPEEATILKHAYTFGISEWELFWPLAVGGSLVVPKPGGEKDPEYIFQLCARHPVTVMYMVPSMLNMFLDYIQAEEKDAVAAGLVLRQVITCGEPLAEETIQQHFQVLHEADLDNLYGPTEGSMTVWRCPRGQRIPQVPIGRPIAGIRVYSLAAGGRLAEVNVPGELHFAGRFIARGYLGMPGPTAQVFVQDNILADRYPSERMYKTGDLACWKPDGNLQFLGRADNQIKLRGFRIEIGEIEAVIRGGSNVKDAVVVLAGEGDSKFLAAYVAPLTVDVDMIQAMCKGKLPHYMVPSTFMKLERLPVTDRGKLDKKALPSAKMTGKISSGAGGIVPPRTPMEATIIAIFAEVLGKDPATIGIESHFVSLGGNSVLAGKVTSRLRKALKLPLPGTTLYQRPTAAQISQLVMEMKEEVDDNESGDELAGVEAATPEERYKGLSATRPMAILLTCFLPVLEILSGLSGLLSMVEVVLIKLYIDSGYDTGPGALAVLYVGLTFVLDPAFILFDLLVGLLVKYLFIGRLRPGAHPVFSVSYFKWLYNQRLMGSVVKPFQNYFIGTPALNVVYRLFGARIGRGVLIYSREVFNEPELITIEDGAFIEDEAKITCSSVGDGQLFLSEVRIGRFARARPYSAVGRGAFLPPGHELVPTSCLVGYGAKQAGFVPGGKMVKLKASAAYPPRQQPCLRLCIGVPLLFLIDAIAEIPVYALALYVADGTGMVEYIFLLYVVGEHLHRIALVTLTIICKWLFVGTVRPGSKLGESSWTGMCHWLVKTLVERENFKEALDPFLNTEVLRFVFVLLGARIGRRTSMDMITCATPDLVSIGDYVLFGSKVGIICEDEEKRKAVQLCRGANVLDNCVVCHGCTVGQRAILGTNTLAAPGQYFPPDTINTGNKDGRAVFLQKKVKGTPASVALEAEANRRLESVFVWTLFNIGICLMALFEPVVRSVKTVPLLLAFSVPMSTTTQILVILVMMSLEEFIEAFVLWVLKWILIGKFKERQVVFFGVDHYLWMVWLTISSTLSHIDGYHGTVLYSAFLRCMGTKVGRNCTLFGFTLEFDLLSIGDCVNIGEDCDNTCHTVENMVLKMLPVKLGSYSTMQRHSFVMPGAELGEGAVLFEESQVLKGESVPPGEVWAGNPAGPMKARRVNFWDVPRLVAESEPTVTVTGASYKGGLSAPLLAK